MTDSMLKTRKEARLAGHLYYDTGAPCKFGHPSKRSVRTGNCYICVQNASKRWYKGLRNDLAKHQEQIVKRTGQRAKRLGIEFDIKSNDIVWNTHCPVFGFELSYMIPDKDKSPSLDRHDPNRGYVKGNVVVMSLRANRAKWNLTVSEVKDLYEYLCSR